jgi:hypothetical protein
MENIKSTTQAKSQDSRTGGSGLLRIQPTFTLLGGTMGSQ